MNKERFKTLLDRFSKTHILVVGDFFLDLYLDLDRALNETSLETGLEAYQVIGVRSSPGAAGTVTSNLRALGVQVTALGAAGDDGMGYELLRGLRARGVDVTPLIQSGDLFTPTYIKPMMHQAGGHTHELNRLDIKNRASLPAEIQARIIDRLHDLAARVDGIVIADQVTERNSGVITDRVRAELTALARQRPAQVIIADSRARIGEFHSIITKPNACEAMRAIEPRKGETGPDRRAAERCGRALYERTGRPVFLTVGADGILVFDCEGMTHVPGISVSGPIDIVGAGDSALAGIAAALCCEASNAQAALIGNLVASITIQQIGATGTATPQQVLDRHRDLFL